MSMTRQEWAKLPTVQKLDSCIEIIGEIRSGEREACDQIMLALEYSLGLITKEVRLLENHTNWKRRGNTKLTVKQLNSPNVCIFPVAPRLTPRTKGGAK